MAFGRRFHSTRTSRRCGGLGVCKWRGSRQGCETPAFPSAAAARASVSVRARVNTAFLSSSAGMPPRIVLTEAGPATLKASLCFEAPYLIEKLVNDRVCDSEDEARALFREVKRYLFLNRADQSKPWEMHSFRS